VVPVVIVVVLLAGLLLLTAARRPAAAEGGASQRKPMSSNGLWLLGAVLLGLLLLRFGLQWLAVVGGVLVAVLRVVGPLLRLWPALGQLLGQLQGRVAGGSPPGSQRAGAHPGSGRMARMTQEEALAVLGLDPGASREDVQREYRRLIKKLHPDLGGSTYLTAKLNEARDVLL
jgi:DnaJ family protein C protein 19